MTVVRASDVDERCSVLLAQGSIIGYMVHGRDVPYRNLVLCRPDFTSHAERAGYIRASMDRGGSSFLRAVNHHESVGKLGATGTLTYKQFVRAYRPVAGVPSIKVGDHVDCYDVEMIVKKVKGSCPFFLAKNPEHAFAIRRFVTTMPDRVWSVGLCYAGGDTTYVPRVIPGYWNETSIVFVTQKPYPVKKGASVFVTATWKELGLGPVTEEPQ